MGANESAMGDRSVKRGRFESFREEKSNNKKRKTEVMHMGGDGPLGSGAGVCYTERQHYEAVDWYVNRVKELEGMYFDANEHATYYYEEIIKLVEFLKTVAKQVHM